MMSITLADTLYQEKTALTIENIVFSSFRNQDYKPPVTSSFISYETFFDYWIDSVKKVQTQLF